jgi:hypothetical protein
MSVVGCPLFVDMAGMTLRSRIIIGSEFEKFFHFKLFIPPLPAQGQALAEIKK